MRHRRMKRVLGSHTIPLYERTSLFRIYEHNVIPGLFQTAAYCAAMLSFWIETTTIVTRPSPATGYAIVTPSSAQA